MITELAPLCEVEVFDTGHLWYAKSLFRMEFDGDALVQLCMGVPWGAPDDLNTFIAMAIMPDTWTFSAFALGRNQMPTLLLQCLLVGMSELD